jgi:hypothetical protein
MEREREDSMKMLTLKISFRFDIHLLLLMQQLTTGS